MSHRFVVWLREPGRDLEEIGSSCGCGLAELIGLVAVAVVAVGAVLTGFLLWREYRMSNLEKLFTALDQAREKHRKTYLDYLRDVVAKKHGKDMKLERLVLRAGMPPRGLYVTSNSEPELDSAAKLRDSLVGCKKQMWDVASAVYPHEKTEKTDEFEEFDGARRGMVDMFSRTHELYRGKARKRLRNMRVDVVAGCWLETALSWDSRESGRKEYLFKLGERFTRSPRWPRSFLKSVGGEGEDAGEVHPERSLEEGADRSDDWPTGAVE